jgi:hypothetical protein
MNMEILCESKQDACDKLVGHFNELNERARDSLELTPVEENRSALTRANCEEENPGNFEEEVSDMENRHPAISRSDEGRMALRIGKAWKPKDFHLPNDLKGPDAGG